MAPSRMEELVEPVAEAARGVSRLLGATDDSVQAVLLTLGGS